MNRPTLAQTFAALAIAIAGLLVLLFMLIGRASDAAVLQIAETTRQEVVERATERVEGWLGDAQRGLDDVESQIARGVVDPDDPAAIEAILYARMLANEELGELTFTRAASTGWDEQGEIALQADPRWQVSLSRGIDGAIRTDITQRGPDGQWRRMVRARGLADPLRVPDLVVDDVAVDDPTEHLTFSVPASRELLGLVQGPGNGLWTDLSYSELDSHLPEDQRRVVVAVMKRADRGDAFVGILRASIFADRLDELVRAGVEPPLEVMVVDDQGRAITALQADRRLVETPDYALRLSGEVPPEIAGAVAANGQGYEVAGEAWRATLVDLPNTRDWRLVVAAPQGAWLGDLVAARNRVLGLSAGILVAIGLAGLWLVRSVQMGLGNIAASANRTNRFDFSPSPAEATFRDVRDVLVSIERSKTALRAMGKYVPVDLVRELHEKNVDPVLGGQIGEVTMMFTDIAGFTTISERLDPNTLATVLGRYLEVMCGEIEAQGGTIDKFIGDAVMALWNVPTPCDAPSARACRAALACVRALRALEASPEWAGKPSMYTRFGIHHDNVMVGHFGAPARMSYTVLGDGVNLASRLEGLNKAYGTTILVSDVVEAATRADFAYRPIDLVAVKGKERAVAVYELLGELGSDTAATRAYTTSFEAYRRGDFAEALAGLDPTDAPSMVLAERCRRLIAEPPDAWDGVFKATEK